MVLTGQQDHGSKDQRSSYHLPNAEPFTKNHRRQDERYDRFKHCQDAGIP